jgi:hypothetical protein
MGSSVEDENKQLIFPIDKGRMEAVMEAYDCLPEKLRRFVQQLDFSLHDSHIMMGSQEVARVKIFLQHGGRPHFEEGNGQN